MVKLEPGSLATPSWGSPTAGHHTLTVTVFHSYARQREPWRDVGSDEPSDTGHRNRPPTHVDGDGVTTAGNTMRDEGRVGL